MRDTELYARILGVQRPWMVTAVDLRPASEEVFVRVTWNPAEPLVCKICQKSCPGYDSRERTWRHLDTCQFKTFLVASVPRVNCPSDGVHHVEVPWADPKSGFTALMEALVIDWLKEAPISAVAARLRLTWDQVDTIQRRAVRRGLARRRPRVVSDLGVDETSFQRRHEYVTVVSDLEEGIVLHVGNNRESSALDEFFDQQSPKQLQGIRSFSMDMWQGYITSTLKHVPDAATKICFDRFHVMQHINEGVNTVRKREHRELRAKEDDTLTRSKYLWLRSPENLEPEFKQRLDQLVASSLKTGRAWAIKEASRHLWHYVSRTWAEKGWKRWIGWTQRSRLEPMKKAGAFVKKHLWGILNAVVLNARNARAESLNAKIQWIKKMACGFRNRERFRNAILFHAGGLDLYPQGVRTHTNP